MTFVFRFSRDVGFNKCHFLIVMFVFGRYANAQSFEEENVPILFAPQIISTDQIESGPLTFSEDGRYVYFSVWAPDHSVSVLCESELVAGQWTEPRILPFSGKFRDNHPFISHDGKKLFFSSDRPKNEKSNIPKDCDIWFAEKQNGGWAVPQRLGDSINSPFNEYSPCVTLANTIYFTRLSPEMARGGEIYYSDFANGYFNKAKRLENDSINSTRHEWHVYVTANGKYMFFTTLDKAGAGGGEDLFISIRKDKVWQNPVPFPFNGLHHDYLASLGHDGKYFYFVSEREDLQLKRPVNNYGDFMKALRSPANGRSDFYFIEFDVLLKKLKI